MQAEFNNIEDFLKNESFVQWTKHPNTEGGQFWNNWLEMNPDKKQDARAAQQIILSMTYKNKYALDEQALENLFEQIKNTQNTSEKLESSVRPVVLKSQRNNRIWWAVAASLALLVVLGFGLKAYIYNVSNASALAVHTFKTAQGERKKITLTDGSTVTLNTQSSLQAPEQFSNEKREVVLEGEAFFEVVKNPSKPFIVKTKNFETQVLGTSFNVRAYTNDQNQNVAVITGKVKMMHSEQVSTLLTPNEIGNFSASNAQIIKNSFNPKEIVGWKDGLLVFEKADFQDVFKRLEAWYGVEIVVDKRVILRGRYSGEFQNNTLEEVLTGIAYTSAFKYSVKNRVVYIHL